MDDLTAPWLVPELQAKRADSALSVALQKRDSCLCILYRVPEGPVQAGLADPRRVPQPMLDWGVSLRVACPSLSTAQCDQYGL
jgi:hypothetical protein